MHGKHTLCVMLSRRLRRQFAFFKFSGRMNYELKCIEGSLVNIIYLIISF